MVSSQLAIPPGWSPLEAGSAVMRSSWGFDPAVMFPYLDARRALSRQLAGLQYAYDTARAMGQYNMRNALFDLGRSLEDLWSQQAAAGMSRSGQAFRLAGDMMNRFLRQATQVQLPQMEAARALALGGAQGGSDIALAMNAALLSALQNYGRQMLSTLGA